MFLAGTLVFNLSGQHKRRAASTREALLGIAKQSALQDERNIQITLVNMIRQHGCMATIENQILSSSAHTHARPGSVAYMLLQFLRIASSGMAGLEVCPGRKASTDFGIGDEWLPCDPVEGAITVNLGDLLMYWTDDVVMSNYHRVRVPRPDEYQVS